MTNRGGTGGSSEASPAGRVSAVHRATWMVVAIAAVASVGSPLQAQATCVFRGEPSALSERPSPLDSLTIPLGSPPAKLCYGRPSARGRTVVGGLEPHGTPWRLGANEPTTLHLPWPASIGSVDVPAGSYSLYAIPEPTRWTIVVNGNTNRWGIPISPDVRRSDLGSFTVATSRLDSPVETLTFSYRATGEGAGALVYAWEQTTFDVPLRRQR